MNEQAWQLEQFERYRPHLQAVAYRMLGSVSEADDALQEAWLRLSRADTDDVANLGGWLTTVVGRVCLDMLRSRRSRQEDYVGSWLPEPIVSLDEETDPEQEAILADSVGLALLVVLETLTPAERLAFVLHDMFGVPFEEIAPIVDRTPAAARQLASRARRRVRGAAPKPDPTSRSSARSSTPFSPPLGRRLRRPACRARPRRRPPRSTAVASARALGHRSSAPQAVARQLLERAPGSRGPRGRRSSTAPPVWSSLPARGQSRSSASP